MWNRDARSRTAKSFPHLHQFRTPCSDSFALRTALPASCPYRLRTSTELIRPRHKKIRSNRYSRSSKFLRKRIFPIRISQLVESFCRFFLSHLWVPKKKNAKGEDLMKVKSMLFVSGLIVAGLFGRPASAQEA